MTALTHGVFSHVHALPVRAANFCTSHRVVCWDGMQDWIVDLRERSMQPVLANPSKQVMRLLNNSNITPLLGTTTLICCPFLLIAPLCQTHDLDAYSLVAVAWQGRQDDK